MLVESQIYMYMLRLMSRLRIVEKGLSSRVRLTLCHCFNKLEIGSILILF